MSKMTVSEAVKAFSEKHNKELNDIKTADLVIHGKAALFILKSLVANFQLAYHDNHFLVLDHYFTKLTVALSAYKKDATKSIYDPDRAEMLGSLTPQIMDLKVYIEALAIAHAENKHNQEQEVMKVIMPEMEKLLGRGGQPHFGQPIRRY